MDVNAITKEELKIVLCHYCDYIHTAFCEKCEIYLCKDHICEHFNKFLIDSDCYIIKDLQYVVECGVCTSGMLHNAYLCRDCDEYFCCDCFLNHYPKHTLYSLSCNSVPMCDDDYRIQKCKRYIESCHNCTIDLLDGVHFRRCCKPLCEECHNDYKLEEKTIFEKYFNVLLMNERLDKIALFESLSVIRLIIENS